MSKMCGAKYKRTHEPCRKYAMPNGRCYLHGGATPAKHSNYKASMNALKHGMRSKKMLEFQKMMGSELKAISVLYNAVIQNKSVGNVIADYIKQFGKT